MKLWKRRMRMRREEKEVGFFRVFSHRFGSSNLKRMLSILFEYSPDNRDTLFASDHCARIMHVLVLVCLPVS